MEMQRWIVGAAGVLAAVTVTATVPAGFAQERFEEPDYERSRDSEPRGGGPQGEVTRHEFRSEIYPGTLRQFYIYVPEQYRPGDEAALLVCQDGHTFVKPDGDYRAPVVLDNLIRKGEMPVTVGVFVNPGWFTDEIEGMQEWREPRGVRSNRSVEYDTLSDTYVRFLEEELLPEVEEIAKVKLSKDPAMRAICGNSSGGICAFTAAWERPGSFGKVISHIGSFTNIRGGDVYPGMVRATDKKPIRVFLQDGSNDLDNRFGNWWLANLQMEAALKFKDYDYKTVWGEGGHNGKHGGAIFPDTLRWVWRDWKER